MTAYFPELPLVSHEMSYAIGKCRKMRVVNRFKASRRAILICDNAATSESKKSDKPVSGFSGTKLRGFGRFQILKCLSPFMTLRSSAHPGKSNTWTLALTMMNESRDLANKIIEVISSIHTSNATTCCVSTRCCGLRIDESWQFAEEGLAIRTPSW